MPGWRLSWLSGISIVVGFIFHHTWIVFAGAAIALVVCAAQVYVSWVLVVLKKIYGAIQSQRLPRQPEMSMPASSAAGKNQDVHAAKVVIGSATEPIQVGEYYVASSYRDMAYLPPTMVTASIWEGMFLGDQAVAVCFILIAPACYMMLKWPYSHYVGYFDQSMNRSDLFDVKQYGFMAGLIILGFSLLPEIKYDMYIIIGILLGVWFLWSLVYYTQTRLRLREWYAQRDCDVFEAEHDDKSSRGVAEKPGLVATRQQGKTRQLTGRNRRRYVGRLKRYKCSSVLARHVILINLMAFYFDIDARLPSNLNVVDTSFDQGLLLLMILIVTQAAWWYFIHDDERLREAISTMGAESRLFIDFEWMVALCVIPYLLLAYSVLGSGGMLPEQLVLYSAMICVQIILFFLWLYPGRIPE